MTSAIQLGRNSSRCGGFPTKLLNMTNVKCKNQRLLIQSAVEREREGKTEGARLLTTWDKRQAFWRAECFGNAASKAAIEAGFIEEISVIDA